VPASSARSDGEQDAVLVGFRGLGDLNPDPLLNDANPRHEFGQAIQGHGAAYHGRRLEGGFE